MAFREEPLEKLKLRVEGMTCVNCAKAIERALRRYRGVKEVEVSFELGLVSVEYEEEFLNPEMIAKVINDLGYKVISEHKKKEPLK